MKEKLAKLRELAEPEMAGRRDKLTRGFRPAVSSQLTAETYAAEARFVRLEILAGNRRSTPSLDEFEVFSGAENIALRRPVTARKTRSTMDDGKAFYQPELLTDGKFDAHWISGDAGTGQVTVDLGSVRRIEKVQWSRDHSGAFQDRFLGQVPVQYRVEVFTRRCAVDARGGFGRPVALRRAGVGQFSIDAGATFGRGAFEAT